MLKRPIFNVFALYLPHTYSRVATPGIFSQKDSCMKALRPCVDLHTHTTYSDGADTPQQLVATAAQLGLHTLAVTDHDTVAALPEARQAGDDHGVTILPGIELSVQYGRYRDVHLLGYCFDATHPPLLTRLRTLQEGRIQRGTKILQRVNARLRKQGRAPLDPARVLARAQGALARPHVAQELLHQGYVDTMQHAFQAYLIPCNVPKAILGLDEACALISAAGGICSLAHPGVLSTDPKEIETFLSTGKAMGMAGVEVYHHCHSQDYADFVGACARRLGLIATGGSDYHGNASGATLGYVTAERPVPDTVLSELFHAHAAHQRRISA
jgi:predicted metal-dependent phosphoesterase TrpH